MKEANFGKKTGKILLNSEVENTWYFFTVF